MCQCRSLAFRKSSYLLDGRVFGTWDFKWPLGTMIDVYFQALPPGHEELSGMGGVPDGFNLSDSERALVDQAKNQFGTLTRVVECLARRWLGDVGAAQLDFKFHHDDPLPPPPPNDSKSDLPAGHQVRTYDVLVSLAPLPQFRRPPPGWPDERPIKLFLPGSELGRYAQRPDYGVPTTYLGKREQLKMTLSEYFVSAEFWNWCVHEFGHVLGLPHEHQNPKIHENVMAELRTPGQILEVLQSALGNKQDITASEIAEEITTKWPVVSDEAGRVLYSDFRDYQPGDPLDDTSSIMFHIFWQRLRQGSTGKEPANFQERPTASDLAHLRAMYP
jgi:hypothetical protein